MDETLWVGVQVEASVEVPSDGDVSAAAEEIIKNALLTDDRIKLVYANRAELLIER